MKLFKTYTEEEKLVKDCARGKSRAQEQLYHQHYRTMFGVCLRYTQDREVAEDILQEGFIKVFSNIGRYRGTGSLEGWIRRIMVNTALEHHRKMARFLPLVDLDEAMDADAGHDVIADLGEQEILKLIQALPDGYRTIFNLYAIEGYTHREIAKKLEISEGTSKSQFARARRTLQESIFKLQPETYGKAQ